MVVLGRAHRYKLAAKSYIQHDVFQLVGASSIGVFSVNTLYATFKNIHIIMRKLQILLHI